MSFVLSKPLLDSLVWSTYLTVTTTVTVLLVLFLFLNIDSFLLSLNYNTGYVVSTKSIPGLSWVLLLLLLLRRGILFSVSFRRQLLLQIDVMMARTRTITIKIRWILQTTTTTTTMLGED